MRKYIHDFRVIDNKKVSSNYFILDLQCPDKLPQILPGQFAEILVEGSPLTYLRRPFSIYDANYENNRLSIMIKLVGHGTEALSNIKPGENVNLIYPLGNSFGEPLGSHVLLVGGGVGIAPMLLLAKRLFALGIQIDVLIGGRSSQDIIEAEKYASMSKVMITTEDGSSGYKGLVTYHPVLTADTMPYSKVYVCGPDPMMKAVAAIAFSKGVPCEVSLENLMACGIGACLCCIVETNEGNKTSCVEGPVFDTRTLTGWH